MPPNAATSFWLNGWFVTHSDQMPGTPSPRATRSRTSASRSARWWPRRRGSTTSLPASGTADAGAVEGEGAVADHLAVGGHRDDRVQPTRPPPRTQRRRPVHRRVQVGVAVAAVHALHDAPDVGIGQLADLHRVGRVLVDRRRVGREDLATEQVGLGIIERHLDTSDVPVGAVRGDVQPVHEPECGEPSGRQGASTARGQREALVVELHDQLVVVHPRHDAEISGAAHALALARLAQELLDRRPEPRGAVGTEAGVQGRGAHRGAGGVDRRSRPQQHLDGIDGRCGSRFHRTSLPGPRRKTVRSRPGPGETVAMSTQQHHSDLRTVRVHGHEVAYRTGGEGPVVLLVHGMAGSSDMWRPTIPLLAPHVTYVAPDLPGHGRSDKPKGDYSLGAQASFLPRPDGRARPRAGDRRRSVARRRHRPAVRLPVPGAVRAPGAGLRRRAGPGGQPDPACPDPAGHRPGAAARLPAPVPQRRRRRRRTDAQGRAAAHTGGDGDLAQLLLAHRARDPAGVPRDADLGGRRVGPEDQRARPPVPGVVTRDPDRVGRCRPDHPGPPRARDARGDPRAAGWSCSRGRATTRIARTRCASPRCSSTSSPRPTRHT